ncbi:MAG: dicarboxylate/amino acid:cation symporter [Lachnospiraceae bacterium]|nr:dicarboxylate/amino acid:cation symporter [Lachnospiraceae bacterium]
MSTGLFNEKKTVSADEGGISEIVQFVRDRLSVCGINAKDISRAALAAEEAAGMIISHSAADHADVHIRKLGGMVYVDVYSKGDRFDPAEKAGGDLLSDSDNSAAAQSMISSILLRSMSERFVYRNILGTNLIRIKITRSKRAFLYQTLGSMAVAIIAGLLLSQAAPASFNDLLDTYILTPVKTMYLNGLKMVVAPVVFFSIVSCIVRFTDISELGHLGGRIMSLYLITTVIAVFIGIGAFYLFRPGGQIPADVAGDAVKSITSQTMNVSIKDTIVGIVPSDFVEPFVESNMLQLIFLAIICGISAGAIGQYSQIVKSFFEALNDLFLKMTTIIIRFMPAAVFCSICSMMLKMGIRTIASVFGIFGTFLFGLACQMAVYCIIMTVYSRMNPMPFLKKYPQTMIQVFSMASSNASIPLNLEACRSLGVAKKLYSLSIPLGATVNMDGGCIYMAVFALALAKIYGVQVSGASITAMVISIVVLSIGAPGIPGSGLICLSVLLTQIGVPTEAIGLVMGIDSLVGMFRCMSNCTGDVAVSIAVAKREKLLDADRYMS